MDDFGCLVPLLKLLLGFLFFVGLQALGVYLIMTSAGVEMTFVRSVNMAVGLILSYVLGTVIFVRSKK